MATFLAGGVPDGLMSQHDYLTREMGYNSDEADEILSNVMENLVPIPEPEPVLATELAGPV
jgi:hypothetical protein